MTKIFFRKSIFGAKIESFLLSCYYQRCTLIIQGKLLPYLCTTIMEGHRAAEPIMDLVTTFALLVSAFSLVSTKHTAELPHRLTKIHKNSLPSYFNNTEHSYEYIRSTLDKIEKLLRNYFLCNFWEMFHH